MAVYDPPAGNNADLVFVSPNYIVPLGNDADLVFVSDVTETINQIWTDDDYVYTASSFGGKIYDIDSEEEYAYIDYTGGFNTVWGNDDYVFYGTTNSGIKYINKTCISGSIVTPINLYECLRDFSDLTPYYEFTSNNVSYIHGYGDILGIVTTSGIDIVKIDPQSYRSCTTISGVSKCFMSSNGNFYYVILSEIYKMNDVKTDWSSPDVIYDMFEDLTINDIFVYSNTIYAATSSGVYLVNEADISYDIYYVE